MWLLQLAALPMAPGSRAIVKLGHVTMAIRVRADWHHGILAAVSGPNRGLRITASL